MRPVILEEIAALPVLAGLCGDKLQLKASIALVGLAPGSVERADASRVRVRLAPVDKRFVIGPDRIDEPGQSAHRYLLADAVDDYDCCALCHTAPLNFRIVCRPHDRDPELAGA